MEDIDKIKVGTILRNNDPRRQDERVTVIATTIRDGDWYATYQGNTRMNSIRFDRIHTDGRPRHQGWSVVPSTAA